MKKLKGFDFIVIAILSGLVAFLDIIAVIGLPTGILSVSSLYIGSAFYLLFIKAFKLKGVLAIYIGLLMASFFTTGFSIMPLFLAWGNVLAPLFIIILMKKTNSTYTFKSFKNIFFETLSMIIAPFISGGWILGGFVIFKIIPTSSFIVSLIPWGIGGIIVNIAIGVPLMKFVLPLFEKYNISN